MTDNFKPLPLIVDPSFSNVLEVNGLAWERVYQAFKLRLKNEGVINVWPEQK